MPHFVILRRCPIFLALAMLTFTGCIDGGADTPTPSHATNGQAANANPRKLRVLVIDDPEFASALQEFWQTQGDGDLVVDQKSQTQILPKHRRLGTDIVIFPCTMLPDMANRRLLAQVPDETWSTDFDGKDLLPNARKLCYYDGLSYAVPLTYSQLQLGYRTDILKAHSIDPPKTWSQYMDAVRQLDAVTDTSWTATCEPLAAGWRSEMFFARHGSFMKHRKITSILFDTKSLQPQLDNDAGKLAITQLTDVAKLNPAQLTQSPTNTLRELISGQTAMAITLPSANVAGKSDGKSHPLAFVPLPSSERYYVMRENSWQQRPEIENVPLIGVSSRMAAVAFESPFKSAAFRLIATLATSDGYQKVSRGTSTNGITRLSQLRDGDDLIPAALGAKAAQSCRNALDRSQGPLAVYTIRLPGRAAYLEKLDKAIEAVISGRDAAEQLHAVENDWNAISDQNDRDNVLEIYRRSVAQ